MNNFRQYLALVTALLIAGAAAFFSITGLSKLFAGAVVPVIIMASFLELGKIISASFLQVHGKDISKFYRFSLTIFVVILMFITSIGIYGFLTDAYQKTAHKYENIEKQTEIIDKKETLIKNQIKRNEDLISARTERQKSLTTLRATQENRIDNLLSVNKNTSAKTAQKSINDANEEMKQIGVDINEYNSQINVLNDSINSFENQKFELSNSSDVAEIGPLKYVSKLTGYSMDSVANWLIMMLIFVFDPLAIILLISAQSVKKKEEKIEINKEIKKEPEIETKEQIDEVKKIDENVDEIISHDLMPVEIFENEVKENVEDVNFVEKSNNDDIKIIEEQLDKVENNVDEKEKDLILQWAEKIIEKNEEFEDYYKEKLDSINKYKTKFIELIDILYDEGKVKKGENLLNYLEFIDRVEKSFDRKFTIDDIRKFLTMCNFLKITSLNHGERKALVDFNEAKQNLEAYFKKE